MKLIKLCSLFLALVLISTPVFAAEANIAVVDVQRMLSQSDASKNIQKQLEKHRKTFLEDLSKQEQTLRDNQKKLLEQRGSLEKEEFAKKAKEFEEKLLETRRSTQKRKGELDKASAQAIGQLRVELVKIVEAIADEKDYTLVISTQNVVVGEKTLDISEEVMTRLNKSVKEIPVKLKK